MRSERNVALGLAASILALILVVLVVKPDVGPWANARSSTAATKNPPIHRVKPVIRGLVDPFGLSNDENSVPVNTYVVAAAWAELQPEKDGPIVKDNPIEQALRRTRQLNKAGAELRLKVRLFAGIHAPTWAKQLGGEPFRLRDPMSGQNGQIGRFWTKEFGQAYEQLQEKLAARYDGVPEVAEVTVSRCTTIFAEPFLRQISFKSAGDPYLNTGYSVAADRRCQRNEIDAHRVWRHTRSGVAFNPYQYVGSDGTLHVDEGFTEKMMSYCRASLGSRCVLENNSIRWPSSTGRYATMYEAMRRLGGPISFQTAAAKRIGDPVQTVVWAIEFGADAVELGARTTAYTPAQLNDLAARFTVAKQGAQLPES